MINVNIVNDWQDIGIDSYFKSLKLLETDAIEREFRHVVEWEEDAFKDEMSLKIMKDIDNAVRYGDYGVETPLGKSCITCLSTGCKFALLMWYYASNNSNIPIVTEFGSAGENVWKFIADNFDISIYMLKDYVRAVDTKLIDGSYIINSDGNVIRGDEDRNRLFDLFLDFENEGYDITKQKESEAYNQFLKKSEQLYHRLVKEEISLKDYLMSVNNSFEMEGGIDLEGSGFEEYEEYKVVNYLFDIPKDYSFRKLPIWFIADKKYYNICPVKYPVFTELLLWDILYRAEAKETDTYFAMVLDDDERCLISEYPENTLFGVLVERGKKQITVYNQDMAVRKFHEMYTRL